MISAVLFLCYSDFQRMVSTLIPTCQRTMSGGREGERQLLAQTEKFK